MPTPALLLLIATLLPLASFVVLLFFGKRMGTPRLGGTILAGVVGTVAIAGSLICSIVAMLVWLQAANDQSVAWGFGKLPINRPFEWVPVGVWPGQRLPGYLDVGLYVDSLTVIMFAMVTLVSTVVHVFSLGYMRDDPRFPRFFTYLGLFCFSMLGLVIGGTTLQLFIFWELVGLCSYLLIGFWYEKKSASDAAIKAFVVNRIGDFGFLIGFGILFYHLGNVTLPDMWSSLGSAGFLHAGQSLSLATQPIGYSLLTVMGVGLFCGAVGKSAQFPLHVWLPDAMEGPTPVSALIHAATMVAAGVYLVGRIFPILTPDAKLFIAVIGATTLTMAALIAIAQSDIKKVLAYSTLSQLGYMILAMGIGSWVGGLFHLITHAFFKALLFLGSGSVIHAAHHEQELPQYGGLIRKIPVTGITFAIAVLAIAGTPFFSGYYSKDMIIAHAGAFATYSDGQGKAWPYWLLFILPTGIAYVTAFYMTRCWMLTFWGKPRNQHLYDHAHEQPIMFVPLIVLAIFSVIGGKFLNVREMIEASTAESVAICRQVNPDFRAFELMWPPQEPEHASDAAHAEASLAADDPQLVHAEGARAVSTASQAAGHGWHLVHTCVFWAFIVGIGGGFLLYMRGYAVANALMRFAPLRWIHTWLYRRMYFDELYRFVFVAIVMGLSRLSAAFDRFVVDGIVNGVGAMVRGAATAVGLHDQYIVDGAVNGVAKLSQDLGAAVRAPQTGRIRVYVMVLVGAVTLALAGVMVVVLSK